MTEPSEHSAQPAPSEPTGTPDTPAGTVAENAWGRVDATGAVYVRTAAGERLVGSWQTDSPAAALEFFGRRFDDLAVQVTLAEHRLRAGQAAPDDAVATISRVREALVEPQAVGDLDGLAARLDALDALVAQRRDERRAARARAQEESRQRKEALVAQAEQLATGSDWRHGADRLRVLLEEWKGLPRLDRASDDALWRRFSSARTHYTRRRKAYFAEQTERRDAARVEKEAILAEAEPLATSTEWADTARRFRDLMARWKAAGPAPREVDQVLWQRFRAAQDGFFAARAAAGEHRDRELRDHLEAKEQLLVEAEALLPVTDWRTARARLRAVQERWEAAGHVPRDAVRTLDARLRSVEDAVRAAEEASWRRGNPEGRARAQATVAQLRASLAQLERERERAEAAGDAPSVDAAHQAIEARRSWLVEAERALAEFTG